MKKTYVYMFVDALGWEIVSKYNFLKDSLVYRKKVEMQFGYSSAAVPTILSGKYPQEHKHFSFFYYDPKRSPFKFFKYLKYFFGAGVHPKCLFNRGRVRRIISRFTAKMMGYTGYFSLYSVPFNKLPFFDYCEKTDIFALGGLLPVKNLHDVLKASGLKFHISDWRKSEDENIALAQQAIADDADFVFVYTGAFDAFMHDNVFDSSAIENKLSEYEQKVNSILQTLANTGKDFNFTIISDHGMTPTSEICDLMSVVKNLNLKFGKDYVAFFDSTMARFWYPTNSQEVKTKIQNALSICKGHFLSKAEKQNYGIDFENNKYGEDIFITDEGVQVSPCDLGSKALNGMHGYMPTAKDSYACMLSTVEPKFEPKHIKDFFALMKSDIEELKNGTLVK